MTDPTPTPKRRRTTKPPAPVVEAPVEAATPSPEAYAYQGPPGRQVCSVCNYQRRRGMQGQDICPLHPEHRDCPRAPQTEGFKP